MLSLPQKTLFRIFDQLSPSPRTRILTFDYETRHPGTTYKETLDTLHLSQTCATLDTFYRHHYITTLILHYNLNHSPTDNGVDSALFTRIFLRYPSLKTLDLRKCCLHFGHNDFSCTLGEAVSRLRVESLRVLCLRDIDVSLEYLFEPGSNSIDPETGEEVFKSAAERAAAAFPNLEVLIVEDMQEVSGEGVEMVCKAWRGCLVELRFAGGGDVYDEALEKIKMVGGLMTLHLLDSGIERVSVLSGLTKMKDLSFRGSTSVSDDQFRAMIVGMTELEILDLFETDVTPAIASALPKSLVSLEAGHRPRMNARMEALLFGGSTPERNDDDTVFLRAEQLPNLLHLRWGGWSTQKQGFGSLKSIAPQLMSLFVHGEDFTQSRVFEATPLEHLMRMGIFDCSINDRTAKRICTFPHLEHIEIDECSKLSYRGYCSIAKGEACRRGVLKQFFTGDLKERTQRAKYEKFTKFLQAKGVEVHVRNSSTGPIDDDSSEDDEDQSGDSDEYY